MDELRISGTAVGKPAVQSPGARKDEGGGFGSVLNDALGKVTEIQKEAEKAIDELSRGGDVTQAVIAMEKADISFQVMVEVRNKLLSAYEEIMRMQV